jgi:small-conductance mechanosensitive channel
VEESFSVIVTALDQLTVQLVNLIPKLIITLIIWWVGKYLINLGVKLIRKIDIKGMKIDDKAISTFSSIILIAGKILLVLIILDYWGIGKTIIGALANGLTLTFAIALGLAFGKALEPEAKNLVEGFKKKLETKQ